MDKGKDVRKYSKIRHHLLWLKYGLHRSAVLPVRITATAVFLPALLFSLLLGVAVFFQPTNEAVVYLLISTAATIASGWFLKASYEAAEGTIFNPSPPGENPLLPDEELLVRASSSSVAQPAELLRATTETTEQKPEELLRVASGSVSENVLLRRDK